MKPLVIIRHLLFCLGWVIAGAATAATAALDPDIRAELERVSAMGKPEQRERALALSQKTEQLIQHTYGADHPYLAIALAQQLNLHAQGGDRDRVEGLRTRIQAIGERAAASSSIETKRAMADVYQLLGDEGSSARLLQQAIAQLDKQPGQPGLETAQLLEALGSLGGNMASREQLAPLERALTIRQALQADNPHQYVGLMRRLAQAYVRSGANASAEPLLRQIVGIEKAAHEPLHNSVFKAEMALAEFYDGQGQSAQALALLDPLYARLERADAADARVLLVLIERASASYGAARVEQGQVLMKQFSGRLAKAPVLDGQALQGLYILGRSSLKRHRPQVAVALADVLIDQAERVSGDHARFAARQASYLLEGISSYGGGFAEAARTRHAALKQRYFAGS